MRVHEKTWISALLLVITLATFYRVANCDFVSFDDYLHVRDNPQVNGGLSRQGIAWAFTTMFAGNWHPITWISFMLDCQLFGVNPRIHHVVNLLIHAANVLLLFNLLTVLTGSPRRCGVIAALFAIHPLHVESVAWISERKDVLSTMFWLLAIWSYAEYAKGGRRRSYGFSLLIYAVGLMTKPMLVTLPIILLLLDYWPLRRIASDSGTRWKKILLEKLPFCVLAALSAGVTFLAQFRGGAVLSLNAIPLGTRILNALVVYQEYLMKMLWPSKLAYLYPYPESWPAWQIVSAAVTMLVVSLLVLIYGRRFRYLATGWLWYLIMLLPVIGLAQVGSQAMADRYTYLSLVGIFIIATFGISDAVHLLPPSTSHAMIQRALPSIAILVILLLGVCSSVQVETWRNSVTLCEHAVRVTENNFKAMNDMGVPLIGQGKLDEAIASFREALKIKPDLAAAHSNLGLALQSQGKTDEAIESFNRALKLSPDLVETRLNLGLILDSRGQTNEAIEQFLKALKTNPNDERTHVHLLTAVSKLDNETQTIAYYRQAVEISPGWVTEKVRLAWLLATRHNSSKAERVEALRLANEACELEGGFDPDVLQTLAAAYASSGFYDRAAASATKALESAKASNDPLLPAIQERLDLYRKHEAFYRK